MGREPGARKYSLDGGNHKSVVFKNDTRHKAVTACCGGEGAGRQMSRNLGKNWSQIAKGHESQGGSSGLVLRKGGQLRFLPTLHRRTTIPDEALLPVLGTLSEDHCEEQLWEPGKTGHCLHTSDGHAGKEKRLLLWEASRVQSPDEVD